MRKKIFLSPSCHYYKLEQKLDPINAEFLDKVDPDLQTEENEFKMEYYNRIERSTKFFISEGRPGWLSDRGRIYILFGPLMDRISDNMGS